MSEPHTPDPVTQPENPETIPGDLPADPLLGSDSFIDPDQSEPRAESSEPRAASSEPRAESSEPQKQEESPNVGVGSGVAIAAEPISVLRPGEESVEAEPRSSKRRNLDEMSKRPSWLPEDWTIDLRVRSSGASAGLIDQYFVEPSGQRRFRSKVEVLHFLETGSKKKKKTTPEAKATPSESPASKKKASKKRKKSDSNTARPQSVSNRS